jgi:GNAT superfamily N-acetyltransferase
MKIDFNKLSINVVHDFEIPQEQKETLRVLLHSCFPDYFIDREYTKQIPKFRYLVWDEHKLIAQMGIEDRAINIDGEIARIFGAIDLCVSEGYRSNNIATNLLRMLEDLGRKNGIEFIILFADDHRLYERHGYKRVNNICRWLAIDDENFRSFYIFERALSDCFMMKNLSSKPWKDGVVDLIGYLF